MVHFCNGATIRHCAFLDFLTSMHGFRYWRNCGIIIALVGFWPRGYLKNVNKMVRHSGIAMARLHVHVPFEEKHACLVKVKERTMSYSFTITMPYSRLRVHVPFDKTDFWMFKSQRTHNAIQLCHFNATRTPARTYTISGNHAFLIQSQRTHKVVK